MDPTAWMTASELSCPTDETPSGTGLTAEREGSKGGGYSFGLISTHRFGVHTQIAAGPPMRCLKMGWLWQVSDDMNMHEQQWAAVHLGTEPRQTQGMRHRWKQRESRDKLLQRKGTGGGVHHTSARCKRRGYKTARPCTCVCFRRRLNPLDTLTQRGTDGSLLYNIENVDACPAMLSSASKYAHEVPPCVSYSMRTHILRAKHRQRSAAYRDLNSPTVLPQQQNQELRSGRGPVGNGSSAPTRRSSRRRRQTRAHAERG